MGKAHIVRYNRQANFAHGDGLLVQAPPPALQEESLPRNPEHPRGFLDAPVAAIERALHHRLLEDLDGLRQRLVDTDPNLGLCCRDGRDRSA
jgi:hypothetical protein